MAVFHEITKSRVLPLELQSNGTRRPVALLGDNDFGVAESEIHFGSPFFMFGRAGFWFLVLQIIFLAVDE